MISAAIRSVTLPTAVRTPCPPKRAGSPSRSSTASCAPVLAPLGTSATPTPPLSRTVTSTVGLPRESSTSRAPTSSMYVMTVPPSSSRVAREHGRGAHNDAPPQLVVQALLALIPRHPQEPDDQDQ